MALLCTKSYRLNQLNSSQQIVRSNWQPFKLLEVLFVPVPFHHMLCEGLRHLLLQNFSSFTQKRHTFESV